MKKITKTAAMIAALSLMFGGLFLSCSSDDDDNDSTVTGSQKVEEKKEETKEEEKKEDSKVEEDSITAFVSITAEQAKEFATVKKFPVGITYLSEAKNVWFDAVTADKAEIDASNSKIAIADDPNGYTSSATTYAARIKLGEPKTKFVIHVGKGVSGTVYVYAKANSSSATSVVVKANDTTLEGTPAASGNITAVCKGTVTADADGNIAITASQGEDANATINIGSVFFTKN